MITAIREKPESDLKKTLDGMTNEEILKEYPKNIPVRLTAILMNVSKADVRYGILNNSPRFNFGLPIEKKRTRFRIDTKLLLETIPQRKGK